ncbi:G-protein coupled receptor 35 [Rhineura floridana]|uniref:G-protein coupled receptor 35 n=1 Tax=Rhineura floridana TaxID=261503 RepID=UPI002AC8424F|nr:G-protein coupled receptor 35 [Rhineura floridana]
MVNCSDIIKIDKNIVTFELIFYSLVTFFGIIFNTVAMWVFCLKLGKWTETRVYMISLAIADYTLVLTLPFKMYFHYHEWPTDVFCLVIFAIHCINMPMSISIITLIALDRYIAIKYPLKARIIRSPWKATVACLFFWICCLLYVITFLASTKKDEKFCFYKTSDQYLPHILIRLTIFFFIPLAILLFCSIQVIRCLKEKHNASPQEEKITQKAICVISVNLIVFIICFLPFHLSLLIDYVVNLPGEVECKLRHTIIKTIHASSCIANLNCCLDAMCYFLVGKEFQEAAARLPLFNSMQSRSNLTQDS